MHMAGFMVSVLSKNVINILRTAQMHWNMWDGITRISNSAEKFKTAPNDSYISQLPTLTNQLSQMIWWMFSGYALWSCFPSKISTSGPEVLAKLRRSIFLETFVHKRTQTECKRINCSLNLNWVCSHFRFGHRIANKPITKWSECTQRAQRYEASLHCVPIGWNAFNTVYTQIAAKPFRLFVWARGRQFFRNLPIASLNDLHALRKWAFCRWIRKSISLAKGNPFE